MRRDRGRAAPERIGVSSFLMEQGAGYEFLRVPATFAVDLNTIGGTRPAPS